MKHMYILAAPLVKDYRSSDMHLVLPHLYKNNLYREAYTELSKRGDWLMQDNSIFELSDAMSGLMDYADLIEASEVVVPEVLRDSSACLSKTDEFFKQIEKEEHKPVVFAAAVQGKSFAELAEHYKALSSDERIHTICIVFNYEFDAFGQVDIQKLHDGWNRFSVVWQLVREGIWNSKKAHHLLGLFNPAELAQYRRVFGPVVYSSIRSNDSSSVFWHSLYGMTFHKQYGYLFRKIQSHVEFNQTFTNRIQESCFFVNRDCVEEWRHGIGGEILWDRYVEYAKEYGESL